MNQVMQCSRCPPCATCIPTAGSLIQPSRTDKETVRTRLPMRYLPFGTGNCRCCRKMDPGLGVIVMGSLILGGGGWVLVGSVGAVAFSGVCII